MASVFEYVRDQIRALRELLEQETDGRDADERLHIESMDSGLCRAEVHAGIMAKCETTESEGDQ